MTEHFKRPPTAGELFTKFLADNGRSLPSRDAADRIAPYTKGLTGDDEAAQNRAHAQRYHLAHTPALYAGAVADHPQVVDWARAYLRDMHSVPWLLLLGDVGTGKTHQAYGALRYLAGSGWPAISWKAITSAKLYARLRPGGSDDPEAAFADYACAPLLLLDDLGATRLSGFTEEITYRLIDDRYTACLPTIITSNLKPTEFAEQFGLRTTSRLRQRCMRVNLGTEDRRTAPGTVA